MNLELLWTFSLSSFSYSNSAAESSPQTFFQTCRCNNWSTNTHSSRNKLQWPLLPWRDALRVITCFVLCLIPVLGSVFRTSPLKTWNPVLSLKRVSSKDKDDGACCLTRRRWESLSMATRDGEGDERRRACVIPAEGAGWGWETALDRPWNTALSRISAERPWRALSLHREGPDGSF